MRALGRRVGWRDAGRAVLWLAVTAAVLAALVAVAGPGAVFAELRTADRAAAAAVAGVALLALVPRGVGLWVVLAGAGARRPLGRSVALLSAATFVNRVTPSGQAGGAAVNGLLAARAVDVRYETGLAAVLALNALDNAAVLALAVAGAATLALAGASGPLLAAGLTAAGLLAGILAGVVALRRYGRQAREVATTALTPPARAAGRLLPGVQAPDRAAVAARVDGFGASLARLGDDPRAAAAVLALATAGWLVRTLAVWLAFAAVGLPVSPLLLLAVLPAAMAAAAAPVPGGGGGVEAVLVALVTAATGHSAAGVTAAVLLYRGLSYWPAVVVGAAAAAGLLATSER